MPDIIAPVHKATTMKHVLIVDDNAVNRMLAAALFKKRGWQTSEAVDGPAAIICLANTTFDAVLLDISMPGMDGEEVCRHIRAEPRLARLRVVAYTAHAMDHERQRIMEAGFDDIVVKPATIASLLAALPD